MLCTAAEIEEKKQLARERLLRKRTNPLNINGGSCSTLPVTNKSPKYFPKPRSFQGTNNAGATFNSSPKRKESEQIQSNSNLIFHGKPDSSPSIVAKCVLMRGERFKLHLSKHSNAAIELMKTIPSRLYDPKTCTWNFALEHYDLLISKFEALHANIQIIPLPIWIHKLKKQNSDVCYDFSNIEEKLMNTLMPFQEEALCYAIERNGKCLLGDEMGLGKTLQALAIATYYRTDWPLLVVTVASTISVWESTILKYFPSVSIPNIQILGQKSDHMDKPSVVISSYDMMTRHINDLITLKFGVCIFDESHTLKNFKTKSFKASLALAKAASRVLLLSGTPALSKPSELFTQLQLIDELFFINFIEYSKRYCDGKVSPYGWNATGQSNLDELQIILEQHFMIRRTKDSMRALKLPDKIQEIVHLTTLDSDLSIEEKKQLGLLSKEDFQAPLKNIEQILRFFHITASIKVPSVCTYIKSVLEEERRKIIIFAHHMVMLDALENVLRCTKKDYIRIDGRTKNREQQVHSFQTNDNCCYALLSITAANSGITLTAAEVVIFAELHWTPSILAQAEARAHRIGQTKPVTIRYLVGSKTVDEYIWPLLRKKQQTLIEMRLTTESYDNVQTISANEDLKRKSQNTIMDYFSPTPKSTRESDMNDIPKIKRINELFYDNRESETAICSELDADDGIDDLFSNFTQYRVSESLCAVSNIRGADIFDDDMDEFLRAIPV